MWSGKVLSVNKFLDEYDLISAQYSFINVEIVFLKSLYYIGTTKMFSFTSESAEFNKCHITSKLEACCNYKLKDFLIAHIDQSHDPPVHTGTLFCL